MASMTTAHKIACRYSVSSDSDRFSEYWLLACFVENSFNVHTRNEEVTSVEFLVSPKKPKEIRDFYKIENVEAVNFAMKEIRYFPKGIEKFFPKLVGVMINHSNLKEIKQEDLKDLHKIIFLDLSYNVIEILEKDLFKFNPLLKSIDLSENMIKEIDGNVFENLNSLKTLNLHSNLCVIENAIVRYKVEKLIKELKVICMKKNQKLIINEKKDIKFNWKKYFWIILIFGTSSIVFLIYGIFKIFMTVKVSPEN